MNLFKTCTTVAAAVTVLSASAMADPQSLAWDMSIEYQVDSLPGTVARKFAKELATRTQGRAKVTIHYGAALGYKSADQFDAVSDGALPLASSFAGAWGGIDPIFLGATLPVEAKTSAESRKLYEAAKPYFEQTLAKADQKLLAVTPWPNNGIWSKEPIESIAALKNAKIRTFDPLGTVTFREIGASPMQLSWADVIPQLSTGALDAVLTSADGGSTSSLWDLLPSYSQVPYASPWQILHMNRDIYDALAPQDRQSVDAAAKAAEDYGWGLVEGRTAANYAEMRKHGMKIAEIVPDSMIEALAKSGQVAVDSWIKDTGERGGKLLKAYRSSKGSE